jgi:hypothetical protein
MLGSSIAYLKLSAIQGSIAVALLRVSVAEMPVVFGSPDSLDITSFEEPESVIEWQLSGCLFLIVILSAGKYILAVWLLKMNELGSDVPSLGDRLFFGLRFVSSL